MTIINPNSISGITSFTAEADVMNFYKSNGALGSLQLNGCNFYTPSGISTFNNLVVGGTLTYEDVKNVDSVGIITARGGLNVTANTDTDTLNVSGISTFGGSLSIADKIIHTGDTDTAIRFPSSNQISFETTGSEGVRIDGGGRLLVGTTVARTFGGSVYAHLQLEGTTQQGSQLTITRNTNDTYSPNISLVKTRGTSDGAVTIVQDNDVLGTIQFRGADGSDVYAVAADINAEVDGSPSDGTDMPGALRFGTTAEGAASPTERLRITSAGKVGINETSPQQNLHVHNDTAYEGIFINGNAAPSVCFAAGTGTTPEWKVGIPGQNNTYFGISTGNANSNKLLMDANGMTGLGGLPDTERLTVNGATRWKYQSANWSTGSEGAFIDYHAGTSQVRLGHVSGASGSAKNIVFYSAATERIRIDTSGRLLVGTTTNSSPIGWGNNLQVAGTSAVAGISIRRDENGTGGALLVFGKSRGSLNGNTVVQSGDQIGGMYFAGADGTDVTSIPASLPLIPSPVLAISRKLVALLL